LACDQYFESEDLQILGRVLKGCQEPIKCSNLRGGIIGRWNGSNSIVKRYCAVRIT